MASDDEELGERCEELAREVLGPLVLGGQVHPVRPFGGRLGLRIGIQREIQDSELRVQLDVARVRRARLLVPVDTLPELDEVDWAILAALNDLIQITNHNLGGPLTRGRHPRLLANVMWLLTRIPAPRDLMGALSRHATFARALEIVRTDATVAWWTGSASFRGEPPPRRLLAWKDLRRVRVDARQVGLADMSIGIGAVPQDEYVDALALWLGRTPLTDLATAGRASPPFAWSASTLSLVSSPAGRSLAFRALSREPSGEVAAVLRRAALAVPKGYEEARELADGFAAEVAAGLEMLGRKPAERERAQ